MGSVHLKRQLQHFGGCLIQYKTIYIETILYKAASDEVKNG